MKKPPRWLAHLLTTNARARQAFPPAALKAIQAAIAQGEAVHRAQVRVIIEPALSVRAVLHRTSSRERARELFSHYRIWDTEENCGVLIYINLADHKVEIIADRTVARTLSGAEWHAACKIMTDGFALGAFGDSAVAALRQLNALLHEKFASNGSHANELSNRPLIL